MVRIFALIVALLFSAAPAGAVVEFAAEILISPRSLELGPSETTEVTARLRNLGTNSWTPNGPNAVRASYHLLRADGTVLRFDNVRTPLPRALEPGASFDCPLRIEAPREPGDYIVEIDLLIEQVAWFAQRGSKAVRLKLSVRNPLASWSPPAVHLNRPRAALEWRVPGRPAIEALQLWIVETLRRNRAELEFEGEPVFGFAAGSTYPQLWIRDNATIIPTSRFLFDRRTLTSWIRAHLLAQESSGAVQDFLRSDGSTEKNTVESDQESSLVSAAWLATRSVGTAWLREPLGELRVIDRLEASLRFLFEHRGDPETGLLTTAHTADWGDVSSEFPDQRAVDRTESTPLVAGIYTQAMAFKAATQLSSLFATLGEATRAELWRRRAAELGSATNRLLWNQELGFYRVHRHLDSPPSHDGFRETEMFPMGGNAVALLAGLAPDPRARAVVAEALRRRRQFNVSTISGTLLPPYPKDFFTHDALDEAYEYQNGGQWDWFGGRFILAMYRLGDPRATDELDQIAVKANANYGLFEWDTPEGVGRGSASYAGSAGVLGRAVIEGLFGVDWSTRGVTVTCRLGSEEGFISLSHPSTGQFLAYHYRPLPSERRAVLQLNSDLPDGVTLRIPLPLGRRLSGVTVDGAPAAFEATGDREAALIELLAPISAGKVEIRYAASN